MRDNNYSKSNNDIKRPITEGEFTDVMLIDTAKFQEKYGFETSSDGSAWNNESDAFRHAYMQAYLTLRFGDMTAKILGGFHEMVGSISNNQDKAEEIMDLHNNTIGREIGNEIKKEYKSVAIDPDDPEIKEIIARKVAERMQEGKLILDPSGRRKPKKKINIPNDDKVQKQPSSENPCVGTYPVSGYTRADGVEVKGYTRTCGAKHSGIDKENIMEKYKNRKAQDMSKDEIDEFLSAYFS